MVTAATMIAAALATAHALLPRTENIVNKDVFMLLCRTFWASTVMLGLGGM